MPLVNGYSQSSIGKNIKTEEKAGRPMRQAIAIGLSKAREAAQAAKKPEEAPPPAPETTKEDKVE